ncbi:hypothetical protein WK09_32245 [Burkholderia ubonensis]|nr:hypothetical protein WK09_32245 [Burkholderia ubonensis]
MHAAPDDLIARRGIVGACKIAAQLGELDETTRQGRRLCGARRILDALVKKHRLGCGKRHLR